MRSWCALPPTVISRTRSALCRPVPSWWSRNPGCRHWDAGGTVLYAENLAFSPLFTQTSELAGGIGTLSFIEIRLLSPRPTWGDFLTPARGGGVLFDLGSHAIALALLLAGSDDPGPHAPQAHVAPIVRFSVAVIALYPQNV